jgi:hypothetical protein
MIALLVSGGGDAALATESGASPAASSAIYRCTQNGATVFTDHPCPHSDGSPAVPLQMTPLTPMAPPGKLADTSKQEAAAARKHREADAAWLKDYTARKEKDEAIRKGLVENVIVKGMSPAQVESILNLPNRTESKGQDGARWIYLDGQQRRTITFKNGEVVADSATAQQGKKKTNARKSS